MAFLIITIPHTRKKSNQYHTFQASFSSENLWLFLKILKCQFHIFQKFIILWRYIISAGMCVHHHKTYDRIQIRRIKKRNKTYQLNIQYTICVFFLMTPTTPAKTTTVEIPKCIYCRTDAFESSSKRRRRRKTAYHEIYIFDLLLRSK